MSLRKFRLARSFPPMGGASRRRSHMYAFSRAIYRELADEVIDDPQSSRPHANHERVLRACESAVDRLATDRHYFARPARTLFREIRVYFPMTAQPRVLRVVEHYMSLADEYVRR